RNFLNRRSEVRILPGSPPLINSDIEAKLVITAQLKPTKSFRWADSRAAVAYHRAVCVFCAPVPRPANGRDIRVRHSSIHYLGFAAISDSTVQGAAFFDLVVGYALVRAPSLCRNARTIGVKGCFGRCGTHLKM